jgi:hypothetical protein
MKDPALREAVKSETTMATLDKRSRRASAADPKLIVQWVENKPELEKYVGKSLGQIGAGRRASIRST